MKEKLEQIKARAQKQMEEAKTLEVLNERSSGKRVN